MICESRTGVGYFIVVAHIVGEIHRPRNGEIKVIPWLRLNHFHFGFGESAVIGQAFGDGFCGAVAQRVIRAEDDVFRRHQL